MSYLIMLNHHITVLTKTIFSNQIMHHDHIINDEVFLTFHLGIKYIMEHV